MAQIDFLALRFFYGNFFLTYFNVIHSAFTSEHRALNSLRELKIARLRANNKTLEDVACNQTTETNFLEMIWIT